jgi:anti-sigma regulatory factor (Ser/Thr protein kinase)
MGVTHQIDAFAQDPALGQLRLGADIRHSGNHKREPRRAARGGCAGFVVFLRKCPEEMGVQALGTPPLADVRSLLVDRSKALNNTLLDQEQRALDLSKRLRLLRSFLARSQAAWDGALNELGNKNAEHAIRSRAEDMLDICTEIGRAESELESSNETLLLLEQQLNTFGNLLAALYDTQAAETPVLELKGVRYAKALRQLNELARMDHESITSKIVAGPVQDLVESTANLEVIEQQVSSGNLPDRKELHSCRSSLNNASKAMRNQLSMLRAPHTVDQCVRLLHTTIEQLGAMEGRLDVIGDTKLVPDSMALPILRITQVAVRNVVDHANAEHLDITLSVTQRGVSLVVRDDGDGFDVVATETRLGKTGGLGILAMRERAELAGGTLDIRSAVDVGTEVRAVFPISVDELSSPPKPPARAVHAAGR